MGGLRNWRSGKPDVATGPPVRIGGATIDPLSREAEFAGGRQRLQPQNLKVLLALAKRKGQVITRSELVDSCWDGRIVGEDVINQSISHLRAFAALAGGFAIETVPKSGYRLVEAVRPGTRNWSLRTYALIAVGVATAIAAGLLIFAAPRKQGEPPVPTVALVPFASPPGDVAASEVARGARVSLSHMLSEGGFPVRLTDIADTHSDYVISGDVKRSAGLTEANVRLAEGAGNIVVFTRRFEAADKDAGGLPDRIGASVAANLSWTGALMALDRRRRTDPQITGELLKLMSVTVEGGDILQAYALARELAPRAPNSAIAQVSLAFNSGFALGALPRRERAGAVALGRRAYVRALQIAPEFGDTYASWCFLHSPVRRRECESHIRLGMRADPDAPFTATFLGALYQESGRFEEALELARLSIANDRYKTAKIAYFLQALEVNGDSKEADEVYRQAARWWPGDGRVSWGRMTGLIASGNFAALERFTASDPSLTRATRDLVLARRDKDANRATRICGETNQALELSLLCLVVLADVGERDAAYRKMELMFPRMKGRTPAEEERLWLDNPWSEPVFLLSAPSAVALRRDPRFLDVAERVGLLDYWRKGELPDFCRKAAEPVCSRIQR